MLGNRKSTFLLPSQVPLGMGDSLSLAQDEVLVGVRISLSLIGKSS
jgi:hypothetical protein